MTRSISKLENLLDLKLVDSKSKVKYVGRTYDVKTREAAHKKSKEGLKLDVIEDNFGLL